MKQSFAAKSFAAKSFASGHWTGVGVEVTIIAGPHQVVALETFVPGAVAVEAFVPGAVAVEAFIPGTVAVETQPE